MWAQSPSGRVNSMAYSPVGSQSSHSAAGGMPAHFPPMFTNSGADGQYANGNGADGQYANGGMNGNGDGGSGTSHMRGESGGADGYGGRGGQYPDGYGDYNDVQ